MEVRKAYPDEFDKIYLMGFDVWSEGASIDRYIEDCHNSSKYKKGTWFVLSQGNDLLSSLIVYKFGEQIFGIGSIATLKELRKNGYASKLIQDVILDIENQNSNAVVFLYSDIQPEFYEKFGFTALLPEAQRYESTTCMVRAKNAERFLEDKSLSPQYF